MGPSRSAEKLGARIPPAPLNSATPPPHRWRRLRAAPYLVHAPASGQVQKGQRRTDFSLRAGHPHVRIEAAARSSGRGQWEVGGRSVSICTPPKGQAPLPYGMGKCRWGRASGYPGGPVRTWRCLEPRWQQKDEHVVVPEFRRGRPRR